MPNCSPVLMFGPVNRRQAIWMRLQPRSKLPTNREAPTSNTSMEGAVMEKDVTLNLHLSEDDIETIAHAVLNLRGDHFESVGKARRNPVDPPMPVIGEELAIARSLQTLDRSNHGSSPGQG